MIILITALIFSTGYLGQTKYDYCKANEFKGEYCKVQLKLNKLGETNE